MSTRMHEITLVIGKQRYTRLVIADTTIKAARIALDKMPDAIICKPLMKFDPMTTEQETLACASS